MKVLTQFRLLSLVGLLFIFVPFVAAQWISETVPDTLPDYGFYRGAAFDANGTLNIAYSAVTSTKRNAPSVVRFITRSSSGVWSAPQTIDTLGATGISLAIDANGNPAVTESAGSLRYVYQNPTTHAWTVETVEKSAGNDVTSLVFDPFTNQATVSYRLCNATGSGTKFARRTGANAWSKQIVDTHCNGRYSSLAYDSHGNPGIAYSDVCSGTSALNCLKFAKWDPTASKWTSSIVEHGVNGYGTFASLAFDSLANPAITHFDLGVRYLRNNGSSWNLITAVNGGSGYLQGTDLILDSQDHASLAPEDFSSVYFTTENGGWSLTPIATGNISWTVTLRTLGGVPYIVYYDATLKKLTLVHQ